MTVAGASLILAGLVLFAGFSPTPAVGRSFAAAAPVVTHSDAVDDAAAVVTCATIAAVAFMLLVRQLS